MDRDRVVEHFSYGSERAGVWRALDLVVDADAFLDLGYSEWYQPHALGSSQRRLADVVGERLVAHLDDARDRRLLDVGCGRGGPAIRLADRFGFDVTGVDLVPYNVARARANARTSESRHDGSTVARAQRRLSSARSVARRTLGSGSAADEGVADGAADTGRAAFVVGDATHLPVATDAVPACVSVDALVYLPERDAVFRELADAVEPGGVLVLTDLLARDGVDGADGERRAIERFADAWDLSVPATVAEHERALADAGFAVRAVEDLTPHSVGRFRRWTALFLRLHATPAGRLLDRFLERRGVDPATVVEQVRRAHEALPSLRHGLVVARRA